MSMILRPSITTFTDGGRWEAGFSHEKNDCAVRAYALFNQVPYKEAHAIFSNLGRKSGKGTLNSTIFKLLDGENHEKRVPYTTLGRLISQNPNGRFYCLMRGHAFTVIDGVVHDAVDLGRRVRVKAFWAHHSNKQEVPQHEEVVRSDSVSLRQRVVEFHAHTTNKNLPTAELINKIAAKFSITKANARYYVTRVIRKP